MREFKYSLDQVLSMGFYEAHRLWMVTDEIRSRDLQHQSLVMDYAYGSEETRRNFLEWVQERQPRRYPQEDVPQEVLQRFAEAFNQNKVR